MLKNRMSFKPGMIPKPRASVDSYHSLKRRFILLTMMIGMCFSAGSAWSQLTISIAYQGPSAPTNGGAVDPGGAYLVSPGPGATPGLFWGPANFGILPGIYNSAEVDAISWGSDRRLEEAGGYWGNNARLFFSTDEFAAGDPSVGPPSVRSEGADFFSNKEASADVQRTQLFMSQPAPPTFSIYSHTSVLDGNGATPFGGPGLGLVEPNSPSFGPDEGDTLDALDVWSQSAEMVVYFSLDASFIDPLEGPYANAGTAMVNGVNPGDVLVSDGLGTSSVWAPAAALGLGPEDDLDALILWENGNGVFDPSDVFFDWQDGSTDMLLFSVRRNSPVIGSVDPCSGLQIEEGDILTTPCPSGTVPAVFIPAESIGLGTVRNGTDAPFWGFGDDLDAMMVR